MRTGTRTELKRRWTPKGHRPICRMKIGYEFVYLYAALNPYNGDFIALLLPNMTKACFEIFMNHFKKETQLKYGQKNVLLIADGATNHQQSVIHSDNIKLERLPTACPELNPVERFFQQIRTEISNHVFNKITDVEDFLCDILQKYFVESQLVSSLTLFPYLRRN